jgi:hypothetical protein
MVYSDSEWREFIRDYRQGSATQVDFCAHRGLNVWTFRDRLYHPRGRRALRGKTAGDEVRLVRVEVPQAPCTLEIALEGVVVRVPVGTDVRYVASVVDVLRSSSC